MLHAIWNTLIKFSGERLLVIACMDTVALVVVVSHDRHLLKSTTDEFLLVADGKVQEFDGDLEDYAR